MLRLARLLESSSLPFFKVAHQIGPLLQKIVRRFAQSRFCRSSKLQRICPCQQSLQDRFFLLQTFGKSFFRCQCGKVLLQWEQLCKIAQDFCRFGSRLLLLGNGSQCLVKLTPCMGPAAHHLDLFWQPVVPLVAVRMEPTPKSLQECFCFLVGLVIIQHNRLVADVPFSCSTCKVVSSP